MLGRHLGFQRVIFDCDSTLTSVEGIDELATLKGQTEHIAELTRRAMDGSVPLEQVYAARLELLQPTRAELTRVGRIYRRTLVSQAAETVAALHAAGAEVFIVSGGLKAAVIDLARYLKIPAANVFAVEVELDPFQGRWWDYLRHRYSGNPDERYLAFAPTPLAESNGKITVVRELSQAARTMMVGDGSTDLATVGTADLFVGFGGIARRQLVADGADVFVEGPGLAAILPLALSFSVAQKLRGTQHEATLRAGRVALRAPDQVLFKNPAYRECVLRAHAQTDTPPAIFGL
jgi:phosphoserine phosphatase